MKMYLLSFGAGLLVGVIYNLIDVRSPAPPVVALIGLLGMLVGEQLIPVGRQLLAGEAFAAACDSTHVVNHIFGQLPGRHAAKGAVASEERRA